MHLKVLSHGTRKVYKEPVMLMVTPVEKNSQFKSKEITYYSDYDLLKDFTLNETSKDIAIVGLEEGDTMIEVRAFIFSARKYFDQGIRPLIILYTKYTLDELKKKSFSGLESEILQYGNCIIISTGNNYVSDKQKRLKKGNEIYNYVGYQYE